MAEDDIRVDIWWAARSVDVGYGGMVGRAECRKGDDYDWVVGIAIAMIKAEQVPALNFDEQVGKAHLTKWMPAAALLPVMQARERYSISGRRRQMAAEGLGRFVVGQWWKIRNLLPW